MSRKKLVEIPKQYTTKKFKDLQSKWYKKLEKEGFEDLEGGLSDSPYLASSSSFSMTMRYYTKEKETYYSLWTNYLSHNDIADHKLKLIYIMHSEGKTLKEITKLLKSRQFAKPKSIFWVHKVIHEKFTEIYKWNETHEEGLFYVGKSCNLAWLEYKLNLRRDQ